MTLLMYLAKVFICSGILFGYYRLFLRNKLFHHYNRFYLLAALFTSILLPFIKIPVFYQPGNAVNEAVYQTVDVLTVNHWEDEVQPVANTSFSRFVTPENGIYLLYIAGIIVLLVLILKSLLYIRKIRNKYPGESINHLTFYNTREPGTPFSFFRSIFWNEQLSFNSHEGQQIFRHELFHVQQKHSADILLAEIITAIFWYNPFFYLMKKEVKAIHEFLADQYAASGNDRYAYAELLVQQTLAAKRQTLTNHFFQSHIKRRIAMITQFKKSNYGYWSRVMILPVSILLFCAFSLYTHKPVEKLSLLSVTPTETITVVIDPAHGGIDNGAISEQLKEKDIALQISRQIEQLAPDYKVKVVMTRTGDYLPGNATDISQGLKNRTNIVSQTNSSLFISIHVSADREPHTGSGFEVFIPNKNERQVGASTRLGMSLINSISNLYVTKPTLMQRKEQNIWVLDQATCPAVLIECGYITNNKDAAFVTDAANQKLIAQKILEGIIAYKNSTSNAQLNDENKQGSMSTTGGDAAYRFKVIQATETIAGTANFVSVNPDKVRSLTLKMSAKAVRQILGNATRIDMSPDKEVWRYGGNNNQYELSLVFDSKNDQLTEFSYLERTANTGVLSYEKVRTIRKNSTTTEEIKKLFGIPSYIMITVYKEVWSYRSENNRLDLDFVAGKGVVEYFYYSEESKEDTIPKRTTTSRRDTLPEKFDRDTTVAIVNNLDLKFDNNVNTKVDTKVDMKLYKDVQKTIEKKYDKKFDNKKQLRMDTVHVIIDTIPIKTTYNLKLSKPLVQYSINDSFKLAYKTNIALLKQPAFKTAIPNSRIFNLQFKTGRPIKLDIKQVIKLDLKNIDTLRNKQQKPVSLRGTEEETLVRS